MKQSMQFSLKFFAIEKKVSNKAYVVSREILQMATNPI